ncbi:IS110 family transposase, partial [Enterococcus faecium]
FLLIKQLIRTKQHFLENLTYKCNRLAREMRDESTSLFSATLISHMTEDFTLDELAELPLEAFCDILQEKGKGRFKQPENIAKAIQRAITMSYRLGALAL